MNRRAFLTGAVAATAIGGPIAGALSGVGGVIPEIARNLGPLFPGAASAQATTQGRLASLGLAGAWLNSPPLNADALRGKVVLVNFWTYSCINWRRQLPFIRAWQSRYRDDGLVVIGVHSPEFAFERDIGNIRRAARDMEIDYPIAVDNDHSVWRAFGNNAWPAIYLIDAQGMLRHRFLGEGAYDQSEAVIRDLLREAGATVGEDKALVKAAGQEVAADWINIRSPEAYLGFALSVSFTSPGGIVRDSAHLYRPPASLRLNQWALAGDWTVRSDAAVLNLPGGRLLNRFHARDLHLVMGMSTPGAGVRFRVLVDGKPPGDAHGLDVDRDGYGVVDGPRMYTLVRQTGRVAERQIDVEFLGAGVGVFAFTFG
ncbi:Thiol-disulfide isomerase or thioredoxin [Bosea lupini]|uniref:Thiol-disulfide isomerase or thioredoxin n=1 Tax=Bosea lupini TaxID=1036779 RepID=A0A1H7W8Z0_9HYPH|nr:redoxin domain-containing protein [Bosea lupini]SEM18026.1 Thiol-disulfide isomerase or thioredoxin [Bosea lupini]